LSVRYVVTSRDITTVVSRVTLLPKGWPVDRGNLGQLRALDVVSTTLD